MTHLPPKIVIGTRDSDLAMVQAAHVAGLLERAFPQVAVHVAPMKAAGDLHQGPSRRSAARPSGYASWTGRWPPHASMSPSRAPKTSPGPMSAAPRPPSARFCPAKTPGTPLSSPPGSPMPRWTTSHPEASSARARRAASPNSAPATPTSPSSRCAAT
ncbi:hypothetical protein B1C81_00830 [Streptomyces sp. HG99]|nr:hypothetical protein B1C81_00830 [Streptomyces sp. HG99]